MHKQRQHVVDRLEQMVKFAYPGGLSIKNPLLQKIWLPWALLDLHQMQDDSCGSRSSSYDYAKALRDFSTKEYSWAVPTCEALAAILAYGKTIVELGSGLGYWAACLKAAGGQVTAVDDGSCGYKPRFFPATIVQDGKEYLDTHGGAKNSTLFISWGCDMNSALAAFQGEYLAVVGEALGGCTWWVGDGSYYPEDVEEEALSLALQQKQQWRCIREVQIPCWRSIYDVLAIFQRVPVNDP